MVVVVDAVLPADAVGMVEVATIEEVIGVGTILPGGAIEVATEDDQEGMHRTRFSPTFLNAFRNFKG